MPSFNRVIVAGNLTRDVEVKYLKSGTAVAEITLAVNDRVKKNDQWVDECSFIDCVLWARTAEIAGEYCSKGSNVLIEGRFKQETWETDGQKRSKIKVICESLKMLGGKGGGEPRQQRQSSDDAYSSSEPSRQSPPPPDDEIPFAWVGFLLAVGTSLGSMLVA